jgi:excisionase family DNA binding protein
MNDRGAFTVPEYCAWSRIGRTKVYELIADGTLPIVKVGKKTLIRVSDGQMLLNKLVKGEGNAALSKANTA